MKGLDRIFSRLRSRRKRRPAVTVRTRPGRRGGGREAGRPSIVPAEYWPDIQRSARLAEAAEQDPQIHFERIRIQESILSRLPPHTEPTFRAIILGELSHACLAAPSADPTDNLLRAIDCCQQQLQLCPAESEPDLHISALLNLGAAFSKLPTGDRRENGRQAIACYQTALQLLPPQAQPQLHAMLRTNLATAYVDLPGRDRSSNLAQALKHAQAALRGLTSDADPLNYAGAQRTLGDVYYALSISDRGANPQRAIACYREALRFLSPETTPRQYAMAQNNLSNALRALTTGDQGENVEQAIESCRQALRHLSPESSPLGYATVQHNLAIAYRTRPAGDREKNIERAIACCQEALRYRTIDAAPHEHAATQVHLGNCFFDRSTGDRRENLRQAIACYEVALQLRPLQSVPFDYAEAQQRLGNALSDLATLGNPECLPQAIAAYHETLRVETPEIHPHYCRLSATMLGDLHFEHEQWAEASRAYATAVRAGEILYQASPGQATKESEIEENWELYARLVHASLEQDLVTDALVYAEAGKARTFLDLVGQSAFAPPAGLPEALLQQEAELVQALREQEQVPSQELDGVSERPEILEQLRALWDQMVQVEPAAAGYVAARRGEPATWSEMQAVAHRLGPEGAIIEFVIQPDEVVIFVLRSQWDAPRVHREPLDEDRLIHRYLAPYEREMIGRQSLSQRGSRPTHDWLQLGRHLLEPVEHLLEGVKLLVLIPHGSLHYVPLHALTVEGEPAIARRAVTYAPSLAALARSLAPPAAAETRERNGRRQLILGFSPEEDPEAREPFESEARAIADHFDTFPLLGWRAMPKAVREGGPEASIIHLSCHGRFGMADPLESSLILAFGTLTAAAWMEFSLAADIVTLSACETGISQVGRGDDLAGFTRAILHSGASSALVTLCSVDAAPTQQLMIDFYRRGWEPDGEKRMSKAIAFQQATLQLRSSHPDPFHWAPFALVGDWR